MVEEVEDELGFDEDGDYEGEGGGMEGLEG